MSYVVSSSKMEDRNHLSIVNVEKHTRGIHLYGTTSGTDVENSLSFPVAIVTTELGINVI